MFYIFKYGIKLIFVNKTIAEAYGAPEEDVKKGTQVEVDLGDVVFELNKGEGISLTIEGVLRRLRKLKRVSWRRKSRIKKSGSFLRSCSGPILKKGNIYLESLLESLGWDLETSFCSKNFLLPFSETKSI